MRRPKLTSLRTSLDEAFIRNTKSFCRTSLTLTYLLSFTVGDRSHCDIPVTYPSVLIQEFYSNMLGLDSSVPLFHTCVRGTCIVVTSELVSDLLHVPRVKHPNYPGYEHLRIVSKDEMMFAFCKRLSDWGDHQFTPCKTFAKGSRFMNIVMTFV